MVTAVKTSNLTGNLIFEEYNLLEFTFMCVRRGQQCNAGKHSPDIQGEGTADSTLARLEWEAVEGWVDHCP
jgi:hypothetical protein